MSSWSDSNYVRTSHPASNHVRRSMHMLLARVPLKRACAFARLGAVRWATMRAVVLSSPGGPENLSIADVEKPNVNDTSRLLVKVAYTALNRADILQRRGKYPPPSGASETMGLEASGVVAEVGTHCQGSWKVGDRVACLLAGGGYAEFVAVEEELVMRVPQRMPLKLAGSVPEAWVAAYQLLHWVGRVQEGDVALIHAGASGVGLAATQLYREAKALPIVTVSSSKRDVVKQLPLAAEYAIDYTKGPFLDELKRLTGGKGVQLILDPVGASYMKMNIDALVTDGRLVVYGSMGEIKCEVNLAKIMSKSLTVLGSTLRSRPLDYKAKLVKEFWTEERANKFITGEFKSCIHMTYDWTQVHEAHTEMEGNRNAGKIMLAVDPTLDGRNDS